MRIVIDQDVDGNGNVMALHVIHTEVAPWNVTTHPDGVTGTVPVLTAVLALKNTPALRAAAGWNVITKHPLYAGQTRFAALLGEIVRLNDATARAALGV